MATIIHEEKAAFRNFIDKTNFFKFPMHTAFDILWKNNRFFKLNAKLFFKLNFSILKKYYKSKDQLIADN
jgi:hypothetical protein